MSGVNLDPSLTAKEQVARAYTSVFPMGRIATLLAYGSVIDGRGSDESDIDVYLLLESWDGDDIANAREASRSVNCPVDLTLHYADELPEDPSHFRDGNKTCLALSYLASGDLVAGRNIPAIMFEQLKHRSLQLSALHSLFYYLDLLTREMASEQTFPSQARMDKYLARSIIDACMFYEKITYEQFRHMTPIDVIEYAHTHPQIGQLFGSHQEIDSPESKHLLLRSIHSQVRLDNAAIENRLVVEATH